MEEIIRKFSCVHKTVHGNGESNITKIMNTCDEMLVDRGCSDVCRNDSSVQRILNVEPVLVGRDPDTHVYICDEEKVGVKYARAVLEKSKEAKNIIIVSLDGPTPFTRKENSVIQFMLATSLSYNVTRHSLVPQHEVVATTTIEKHQFPKILDTDPVVQYYNWPIGTVVRVWRCYGGHEVIPFYRCVSESS